MIQTNRSSKGICLHPPSLLRHTALCWYQWCKSPANDTELWGQTPALMWMMWGWMGWILLLWPKGNQQLWTTCAKVRREGGSEGVRGGKKWEGAREVVYYVPACPAFLSRFLTRYWSLILCSPHSYLSQSDVCSCFIYNYVNCNSWK